MRWKLQLVSDGTNTFKNLIRPEIFESQLHVGSGSQRRLYVRLELEENLIAH
jgi:hypothetical protein